MEKPILGISACLLGEPVRFDGGHKSNEWLIKELGKQVEWFSVCPEVEMGLGVPRESIRLAETKEGVRLIANETQRDLTPLAEKTSAKIIKRFPILHGFVLKKNSPTCGQERVRIDRKGASFGKDGVGLFAKALMESFPRLPVIEEGRLSNPEEREHFVTRVFALYRWQQVPKKVAAIQLFQQRYKFLILAHSPKSVPQLGKIAANSAKQTPSEVYAEYESLFLKALSQATTAGRRYNVLQHVFGFLKDQISDNEKKSLWEELEGYRSGEISFQTVVSLLRHAARRVGVTYLEENLFWDPYPKALGLRKFLT